jgi:CheY-like chemotaxis protein
VPKRKLLLADDSITIQKVVNLTFADEGIEVIAVGDGNSAMDRLREDLPDLVMADVNMPGLNGYEICEKIKQSEGFNHATPVILLVGSFEPFDEDEARRVGADDYLTKPFQSISQLVEKVSALLNMDNGRRDEDLEDTAEMPFGMNPVSGGAGDERDKVSTAVEENIGDLSEQFDDEMIETERVANPYDSAEMRTSADEMSDFGTDDELIEEQTATYEISGDDEETDPSVAEETAEDIEPQFEEMASDDYEIEDYNQTQPLTPIDFRELSLDASNDFAAAPTDEGEEESSAEPEMTTADLYGETADEAADAAEYGETDGDAEPSSAEVEETDPAGEFFGTPEVEDPAASEDEYAADTAEPSAADDYGDRSDLPMPEIASILELDEVNLLDLPPLEGEEESSVTREEVSEQVRTVLSQELPVGEKTAPAGVSVDSEISPEMVEAITQKVVDRLSDKAVREIAWEVVPQMADLIIKKMAEEKMKE